MIRIYYKEVNGDCSYEQSLAMYNSLTPERQEKIKKLRSAGVARKRIEIGYFLQQVLSRELKVPMDCIAYSYGENGKPALDFKTLGRNLQKKGLPLERTGLYFNMSHSGKYVVIAVSDVDVGIDVEHKAKNYRQVAKRFFCEEEYRSICACPDEAEQKQCFLEIWTKKEAYIKLTGLGMQTPLNEFNVFHSLQYKGQKLCFQVIDVEFNTWDSHYKICVCSTDTEYEVIGE